MQSDTRYITWDAIQIIYNYSCASFFQLYMIHVNRSLNFRLIFVALVLIIMYSNLGAGNAGLYCNEHWGNWWNIPVESKFRWHSWQLTISGEFAICWWTIWWRNSVHRRKALSLYKVFSLLIQKIKKTFWDCLNFLNFTNSCRDLSI